MTCRPRTCRKRSRRRCTRASASIPWSTPSRSSGNGEVAGVRVQRQRLADFDDRAPGAGRSRWGPKSFTLNIDISSSRPSGRCPILSLDATARPGKATAGADARSSSASPSARRRAGVFAAGDAVSGPATIVEAVAQGNLDGGGRRTTGSRPARLAKPAEVRSRRARTSHRTLQVGGLRQRPGSPADTRAGTGRSRKAEFPAKSSGPSTNTRRAKSQTLPALRPGMAGL